MKYFLLIGLLFSLSAYAASEPVLVRMVSVSGRGEVKVKPDEAMVSLQVQSKGKDARTAQSRNAREMARVEKVLKNEFKVDAKDIQTSGFNVQPEYRYTNNDKRIFLGYQVFHSLEVKVRNIEKLGEVLDKIVGKGSEEVGVSLHHVGFQSSKAKELEVDALEEAMKNARSRAEALAKFSKKSLKGVIRVSDSSVESRPPVFARAKMESMAMMDGGAVETQVSPGEIEVSARVSVDFELD